MKILNFLIDPLQYSFIRNALITCICLSVSIIPLGTFLVLRRMTLLGEAFSHGVIPGVVLAFFIPGSSVYVMILTGMLSGFITSALARYVSLNTILEEESAFSGFYMIFFAISMILLSQSSNSKQVFAFLFGSILSVDYEIMNCVLFIMLLTIITLIIIRRPLITICFSTHIAQFAFKHSEVFYFIFLIILSANMVVSFKIFGNLMSLGLMFLPVLSVRIWSFGIFKSIVLAVMIGIFSSYIGILISFYISIQTSAAIVLSLGLFYFSSIFIYIYQSRRQII